MKSSLFKSRKFWIMIVDVTVSLATYFVTRYAAPDIAKDVLFIIGILQAPILAVIGSLAYQNGKHIEAALR